MKKLVLLVLPVLCLMVFPSISHALGFEGIGGKISLVMPKGSAGNNIGFGVIGDLGTILPQMNQLKAEGSLEYWGDSYDVTYWSWSWSAISINATAKYHFPVGGNISPFAGGGLGFVISTWSSDWKGASGDIFGFQTNASDSSSDLGLGIHLVGGVDIPIGTNIKFVAEGKINTGGTDTFMISGGIVVKLK
jgi:opacity protein-like surface antigen